MKRSTAWALLSILFTAIYVRLLPLSRYLYWGADFGEYFLISRLLAVGSSLPDPYLGWGVTYPEFIGMNVVVAAASWAGVPLLAAASLLVPILSSLVVIPVFLIGRELTGKDWPGLLASAVVAVVMTHVYPTSHAVPGALGDVLLVSCILLLLRWRRHGGSVLPLFLLALALVPVHHLSSYFLILVTFTLAGLRILLRRETFKGIRRESLFLTLLVVSNVGFWTLYAENFRNFMGVERFPWWAVAALILSLPVWLYLLALLRRIAGWAYRPSFPPASRAPRVILLVGAVLAGLLLAFSIGHVPGTTLSLSVTSLAWGIPLLGLMLFAPAGRKLCDFLRGGSLVTAWFVALAVSFTVGALLAPTFLIPYRHLQYLTLPLALFTGIGVWQLSLAVRRQGVLAAIVLALVVATAATALPPREVVGNHFEGVRAEAMNVVQWSPGKVAGVVATDHRASSTLFGFTGIRATWDSVSAPLHAATFAGAKAEMVWAERLPGGPARIDYILVDSDLAAGAMLFPWDPARPLSSEALAKFDGEHYLKLYDDGYSQLYWVNWGMG